MDFNSHNPNTAPDAKILRTGEGAYLTVFYNGESLTLREKDSPDGFKKAVNALKVEDWASVYQAMRPVKSFASKLDGVEITSKGVLFNGQPLHNVVCNRIMDFANQGLDHAPLCKFLNKLMKNPSSRAVDELYTFLEHQNLPITDTGNFFAYKRLQGDWYSVTAGKAELLQGKAVGGKIYNGVGEVIEMRRNAVDDNKDKGCSYGLHAGTLEYASGFGGSSGKMVIVEIDPSDVVSIPTDCSFQKLRTCKYKVVGEYTAPLDKPLYGSKWNQEDVDNVGDEEFTDDADLTYSFDSDWLDYAKFDGVRHLDIYLLDGRMISYDNFNHSVWDKWVEWANRGASAGEFYHRNIKGKF